MKSSSALFLAIPFLFLLIYLQVFTAEYAYLDEIHQLWHNNDQSNFVMFHTQGRWITGLLFQKLFGAISTIEQLKFLRVFSLLGWIITAFVWSVMCKTWVAWLSLPNSMWPLGSLYMACTISVCIYIGWASCMEVFLAVIPALLSGHVLFKQLINQQKITGRSVLLGLTSLVLGITSLFIYQNAFGIFLLPFFLYYVRHKTAKPDRVVAVGIVFYLFVYVVYYFLFKYSLTAYDLEASNRTGLHFALFKKISFFFSGPFPQGFSMNLLFLARSVSSQIFYVLIFVIWLVTIFRRNRQSGIFNISLFVGFTLFLLALIYLPSMIAVENFPSYRTLIAFNLAVFLMVTESLLSVFHSKKSRKAFSWLMALWLVLTAIYTFNFQYVNPLKKEYKVLKNFMQTHYKTSINQVYFVRADKFLFNREFHTHVYRDEFGAPSTYRDWVPEPIVKQIVFEITKNRKIAEDLKVIQFENSETFRQSRPTIDSTALVVDINDLFIRGSD
jgi:hypothetical protein